MARPAKPSTVSDQEERFCREYVKDLNGSKAAIRAGYAASNAGPQASRLLADANVSQRVAELESIRLTRADVQAESILRELVRLGRSDIRSAFDERGNLLPPHQWSDDTAACIASVEVVERNLHTGDGATDQIHKIKVWDKPKALDTLAKHLGLLIERVDLHVTGDITSALNASKEAARKRKAGK